MIEHDGNFIPEGQVVSIRRRRSDRRWVVEPAQGEPVEAEFRPRAWRVIPNQTSVRALIVTFRKEPDEFTVEDRPVIAWRVDALEDRCALSGASDPVIAATQDGLTEFGLFDPSTGQAWCPYGCWSADTREAAVAIMRNELRDRAAEITAQ